MTTPSRTTYPQLDSMRAVAAIAVVATHTFFWAGYYPNGLLGTATQRLEVGVAVFFVLSGFLLARPFVSAALHGNDPPSAGRYFWKRALRILPVYWVSVVAALVLIKDNHDLGPGRWLQNLVLTDLFAAPSLPQGLTQMWSLSTEAVFYLILPLLGLFMVKRLRSTRAILIAVGGLYLLNIAWTAATHATSAPWGMWAARWLPNYISWFALGIALAVFALTDNSRHGRIGRTMRAIAMDRATCWFCAVALFFLVSTPIAGTPLLESPSASEAVLRNLLYGAISFLLILPCVLGRSDTVTARLMSHRLPRHLGHISYSLFCCHVMVLYLVAPRLGFELFGGSPIALFVTIFGISLAVAELLYRGVEEPFLRFKDFRGFKALAANAPRAKATKP